jgi:hypothetical protein
MSPENEILADLQELLREHGLSARWMGIDLLVLANRIDRSQQIDIGGFVDAPDLPTRVANRDELRARPCVVLATSDAKRMLLPSVH